MDPKEEEGNSERGENIFRCSRIHMAEISLSISIKTGDHKKPLTVGLH